MNESIALPKIEQLVEAPCYSSEVVFSSLGLVNFCFNYRSHFVYNDRSIVESAGANPGPTCYKKGGPLTVTDANLILGRLLPEYFPQIFGKTESEPLDLEASRVKFELLRKEINKYLIESGEREVNTIEMKQFFHSSIHSLSIRPSSPWKK